MSSPEQAPRRQYVNFTFYKIDPAWRRLPEDERTRGKQEFLRAVEEYQGKVLVIAYTTVGIRGDCDLMLWRISYELELFQEMSTKIMASGLGKYLYNPYSYLAITKRSIYVDHHTHENQESKRLTVVPGKAKYIFVYPFVKTREWFLLTKAARQGMMDEHIEVGHRFPRSSSTPPTPSASTIRNGLWPSRATSRKTSWTSSWRSGKPKAAGTLCATPQSSPASVRA